MNIINFGHTKITQKSFAVETGRAPSLLDPRLNDIHENPVRAGIVENAEDYLYLK